ncbi:hypothetical protein SS05631_c06110 [Sinorhizobium sp. CCBAU 05631]|nr:hypothetical protein SS05631_c06110 [Sinorhizobium sp. CCBAU 05631]
MSPHSLNGQPLAAARLRTTTAAQDGPLFSEAMIRGSC